MSAEHSTIGERPRYGRVLVALDDSPDAEFVLRHALVIAQIDRAILTLLHVVPSASALVAAAGVSPEDLTAVVLDDAARRLRELIACCPDDVSVRTIIEEGSPAQRILEHLRAEPYDLVLLGTRGRGRVQGALLGSVSRRVLHDSPVPVAIFHAPR